MVSHAEQVCYTLINAQKDSESINELSLRNDLENGSVKEKTEALKKLIYMILNGEKFPQNMLMIIIRYILPCNDHEIKKLLLIFWEIVPKRGPDGRLLHEMILVCDAYRKDLQHPNEYIRGSTLRFLCKLKEPELLEPLMSSIRSCLEHRHSYVRRNAVLAIFKIYINFDRLIPDAPELILDFLDRETDASCKRNAFLMLIHLDQDRALDYLNQCLDQISTFNDILQLVIVELIYKVCIANPSERSRFVRAIFGLLKSATSPGVRYEAAATLITLSQAPTALKAAANTFIDICLKESDNNVKLIVLDHLINLRDQVPAAERVLQELLMDLLRILSVASDLEVKEKILLLALDLVSSRNAEETVRFLQNALNKTQGDTKNDDWAAYQRLLVDTIQHICVKYPDVLMSDQLLSTLFEILTGDDEASAQIIITFARAFIIKFPQHRQLLVGKIFEIFLQVQKVKIHRGLIWLLGEFSDEKDQASILETVNLIRSGLGELPIVQSEMKKLEQAANGLSLEADDDKSNPTQYTGAKQLVTADGTYAAQSALIHSSHQTQKSNMPPLRSYLFAGKYGIGSALGACLVKLALKFNGDSSRTRNSFVAECMLILTSILHFGRSSINIETCAKKPINDDDYERIGNCLIILSSLTNSVDSQFSELIEKVFTREMRVALEGMLAITKDERDALRMKREKKKPQTVQVDDHLNFTQLMPKNQELFENQFEQSLSAAIGAGSTATSSGNAGTGSSDLFSVSKLSKVTQLTGFSDPLYAECYVNVNQYDIGLDVLIVNQTSDTLQNVTLELSTLGDLRLVERPSPIIMAPNDFANIKATVKVASTENGVIFGNIAYDVCGSSCDRNVVVLNDVHIDIMDYIQPSVCSDSKFAQMWVEFEWENKVTVNTQIKDLNEYLNHLIASTNMKCLTPPQSLSGNCCFLAANLYARSIFGEDALANVSIEKSSANGPLAGHVRIRAKSQGMALSLGERFNAAQKQNIPKPSQTTNVNQNNVDDTSQGL